MRINKLHKVIMSASLVGFLSSAPSLAINEDQSQWSDSSQYYEFEEDEFSELFPEDPNRAPNCPVIGVQFPDYIDQYNQLNNNYTPLKAALDNFISIYYATYPDISNAAVLAAYTALTVEARTVANCSDVNDLSATDVPGDCEFYITIALPDGWVVFDLAEGTDNTVAFFNDEDINDNLNTNIAVMSAQNFCGNQWETSFNLDVVQTLNYVSYRLGARFDNSGTALLSEPALLPIK